MKLEKINPFIQARYEHGYKSLNKFVKDIGISRSKYWTWEIGRITSIRSDSSYDFHKVCKAFEWTDEEGTENLSNLYQWTKNPDIEIVKPNWDDYKHIKPHLGKEVPMCTLDTTNTDISHELEMLDNPLAKWRAENNLTRYEAGEYVGMDSVLYEMFESGHYKPSSEELKNITEATGLSVTQIAKIYKPIGSDRPAGLTEEIEKAKAEDIVLDANQKKALDYAVDHFLVDPDTKDKSPFKGIYDSVRRQAEENDEYAQMVTPSEAQIILDIIYGKVTLEEYRKIETVLGR